MVSYEYGDRDPDHWNELYRQAGYMLLQPFADQASAESTAGSLEIETQGITYETKEGEQ